MAITMQGNWTVSVKSKTAAFQQRFVIQGSDSADGVYAGDVSTPPVHVTGAQWTIAIEHLPTGKGATWKPSAERLGTPSAMGGQIVFDILSNDTGADQDYDDLVLTCSMAQSSTDYVVYGRVRSYAGLCRANPCFPFYFVIDTPLQLAELLKYPTLRETLEQLYGDRIQQFEKRVPFPPIPEPDPPPFRPMMVPLRSAPPDEASAGQAVPETAVAARSSRLPLGTAVFNNELSYVRDFTRFKDTFKFYCEVKNQPGLLLRFVEYDRTEDELAGGPYTGTGDRQTLGLTVTDEQGNYLFRFTQTLTDIAAETEDIVSGGAPLATQLRPDLLVQVISGTGGTAGVLFETGLFSDIPNFKRINLCLPESVINPGPTACQGGRAIQSIGNIWVITGLGNTLDAQGRITATNSLGPQITRGAWAGRLHVFACFTDAKPAVAYYTIRFRRPGGGWAFVQEYHEHPKISDIGSSPDYTGTKVGPFTTVPLKVDGGPPQTVPYYLNIESDPGWVLTHRTLKVRLSSSYYENLLYLPEQDPRTVEFWIEGYDSTGKKVPGADDKIKLYLDNRPITGDIASIAMGGVAPGECGLFDLPTPNATLTVRFRVHQPGGFVNSYSLSVLRGSATPVAVQDVVAPPQPLSLAYHEPTHGNTFFGTANAVSPDLDNYVVAELQAVAGAWLPGGKNFCAFAFEIHASPRTTNGYGVFGGYRLDTELIGISYNPPTP